MAVGHIVTEGYGNGTLIGSVAFIVRRGYNGLIQTPVKVLTLPIQSLVLTLPTKSLVLSLHTKSLVLTLPQD